MRQFPRRRAAEARQEAAFAGCALHSGILENRSQIRSCLRLFNKGQALISLKKISHKLIAPALQPPNPARRATRAGARTRAPAG